MENQNPNYHSFLLKKKGRNASQTSNKGSSVYGKGCSFNMCQKMDLSRSARLIKTDTDKIKVQVDENPKMT